MEVSDCRGLGRERSQEESEFQITRIERTIDVIVDITVLALGILLLVMACVGII